MILQYQKSHSDVLFRFRENLQLVTVHPNCSETKYLINDIEALCKVESIIIIITVRSETEKSTRICDFLSGWVRKWHKINA